jgi:hypothetical protein
MADYDFSGQEEVSNTIQESNVLGSFGDLSDSLDDKKKNKKETTYDLSGQDDLFPKEIQAINSPKSKITSKFGNRKDPLGAGIKFHNGVDIPMTLNTPVNSLGKGTVVNLGDSGSKDYGRFVEVDYGGGLVLTYGHLNKIVVERGDRVSPEAILGLSGSTGRSVGPHLHIRAKLNGKSVNPEDYFGNMHDIAIGALSNEDVVSNKNYDFSGQDEINGNFDWKEKLQKEVGNIGNPVEIGNLDPYHRKIYKHPNDNGYGTTYSMSFEDENKLNVLIPQIVDGKMLTKEQAIEHYKKTGESFGKFKTWQDADKYAEALHNSQDTYLRQTQPELYENKKTNESKYDFSDQDKIGEVKPLVETPFVDERTFEEKIVSGAASFSQNKITVANPNQLLGNTIKATIQGVGVNAPNINDATDKWLSTIDPTYARINQEYRGLTNKNLITFDVNPLKRIDYGNAAGRWEVSARLTKGSVDLINAYIDGRNKGGPEAGWEAAYFKSQEIKRQEQAVKEQINKVKEEDRNNFAKKHPYLTTALNVLSPISAVITDKEGIKSGISNAGMQDAQLMHNLRMLPEALYKFYRYGGDSDEYEALIERDKDVQKKLFAYQGEIKQPETLGGKIVSGATTGLVSFPKYALAGSIGGGGLPTLVYVENLHRGNREAALSALPMAVMGGVTHGLGEFLGSGTKVYINTLDENDQPVNKVIEVGRGLGNKAPFTRVKGELSIDPKIQSAFIAKDPVSIASFSPLERQILMRGTNALLMGGTTAIEGGSLKDTASNFVVGLTFPVGKYKVGTFDEGKLITAPPVDSPATEQFLLSQPRVNVPVTESNVPTLEQSREINSNDPLAANLEKGFIATGQGQTLYLDLDTAALNLLDLRRSLTDKSFVGTNNIGLKNSIDRQIAIQKAIGVLENQIPKEVIDYFEQNESLIRSALKTNWEAVKTKEEYLGAKQTTKEIKMPDEIKVNDSIDTKESAIDRLRNGIHRIENSNKSPEAIREIAKDVFGNIGEQNQWETPDRILFVSEKIVNQESKLKNFLKNDKGELDLKAVADLTRIAAFHLEDFYHRKIESSVVELANRFKLTLGDTVNKLTDKDYQTIFDKGKEYLDSNIADPFFSRMKQDAVEKLPNKFTEEQARNILSQHKDEFEWTSGLNEFLESNKDKKIGKQELVDTIQKGQVRVEESVAQEIDANKIKAISKQIKELQAEVDKRDTTAEASDDYIHETTLLEEKIENLYEERNRIKFSQNNLKYSLDAYSSEKLELPGAKNSKEVKLITPLAKPRVTDFREYLQSIGLTREEHATNSPDEQQRVWNDYFNLIGGQDKYNIRETEGILYKSAHWDEANVVAHYRANDRISTDNKRIYFGEEFQSDWNHDIREKRVRIPNLTVENFKQKGLEIQLVKNKFSGEDSWVFGRKGETDAENYDDTWPAKIQGVEISKEVALKQFIENYNAERNLIEPNPFMQHNWKELVLKRFLRDAAIAKDKDGNYKYDAIGWTTARQQLERYGGILEANDFKWRKNSDGTYSFDYGTRTDYHNEIEWRLQIHELQNISLERFAELTTKEAADFVREQEIKQKEALKGAEFAEYRGQFSLSETVELRSKEGTYADYDVAYKNILSKIGKRFGAKYSEREINVSGVGEEYVSGESVMDLMGIPKSQQDSYWRNLDQEERDSLIDSYRTGDIKRTEKIHSLEITPSMRESLSKEGLPLYGTGGNEPLKASEFGIRNKIVTTDAFNEARNDLVYKLSNFISDETGSLDIQKFIDKARKLFFGDPRFPKLTDFDAGTVPTGKRNPRKMGIESQEFIQAYGFNLDDPLEFSNKQLGKNSDEKRLRLSMIKQNDTAIIGNVESKGQSSSTEIRGAIRSWLKDNPEVNFIIGERTSGRTKGNRYKLTREQLLRENNNINNTFNSGLNPDAFIDQVRLLYSGIKDLSEFTNKLVSRYGEPIRQFAEDFYFSIKNKAEEFNKKLDIKIEDWQSNLNKLADDPAWQIRNSEKSERGSFSLRKKDTPELKDYYSDKTKHQLAIGLDYRAWMRGIALSQISTEFGKVYDTLRLAQRVVHGYESNILNQLMLAKKIKKAGLDHAVAEAIYEGNETFKVFTDPELATRGLNSQQIDAYKNVRAAIDNVLNLRLEGKLYAVKEKANKLNTKLLLATPGSPEEISLKTQLLDLADAETKMKSYYQKLKDEGYITIQRRGSIAAFIEDPAYPVGDPKRKIYNQFTSAREANNWVQKQKIALGIPKLTNAGSIYDIRNLKEIALKEKLTPSQFEDLIDRSGANSTDPQIERIRTEVYSKFPSFTYQLDREFVRGYDRNLQTAIDSTVHQAELYSSSFYSKVGGEEGMKALESTGLDKSDSNLYKIANQYIKDETSPAEMNWLSKKAIQARRLTYLWQLGFDVNQLYLNAVAQPITQTYGYFSRVSYNGIKLSGLEPEHYFTKAIKLAAKGGDPDFETIRTQLVAEHVLAPEFTKTLIESKTGTGKTSKVEHWASVFMRIGEKATRTHAAAEAYLIGREKFNLTGDDLTKFIVKAVDATQSNPTRGENPYAIRQLGETGKLFYQFLAFNQMWWENLAIGVKESKGISGKSLFAVREFVPLAIMGGLTGLPLAGFAGTMYTLLTGRDPKKDADKYLGDDSFIEQLARYGITTSASLSQKLTPSVPILDQAGRIINATSDFSIGDLADNIPAFATADQLITGIKYLTAGKKLKGMESLSPRFAKGPTKAGEALKYGFRKPSGETLLSKSKQTPLQLAGQVFNITPSPVIEKYERDRTLKLKKNKVFKKLRKVL